MKGLLLLKRISLTSLLALSLVLSLVSSSIFSTTVNAETDYSDLPSPATDLSYSICGNSYELFGEEIPYGESDFGDSDWAGYSNYVDMFNAMYEAFNSGDYMVGRAGTGEGFTVVWTDTPFEGFNYSSDSSTSFLGVETSDAHFINLLTCSGGVQFNSGTTGSPFTFAYGSSSFDWIPMSWRFSNTMSLPTGTYDGPTYDPSWNSPEVTGTVLRPNVIVDVSDKNISINSRLNSTVHDHLSNYKIYWFVTNATFDGDGTTCTPDFSTEGYSLPDNPLTFEVPCYGTYTFNAYYSESDGTYPIDDFDDYTIAPTVITVNINGSYFSVDTDKDGYVCGGEGIDDDYCQPPSFTWEDELCDLTHLGGCVNNIMHYIADWLGFAPSSANPTGSPFLAFTTETYGLTSIIQAPLLIITNIGDGYYTCTPITVPLSVVDSDLQLPCLTIFYTDHLGSYYTIYSTIVNGIVAYYVLVGLLAMVKDFKDPEKDKIEVKAL